MVSELAERTQEDRESESVIDQMLRAGNAPEPGDFMANRVVARGGDEEQPAQIIAENLTSAGHVYVYDTKTGDRSTISRNMLELQFRKRHPDGTRAFTLTQPSVIPARGTHLCLLHTDGPNRREYDRFGFKTCPKANLMTEFDVEQHMKARHKKEWASIQSERSRLEKDEEKAFQRQMMKALQATVAVNKRERKAKAS